MQKWVIDQTDYAKRIGEMIRLRRIAAELTIREVADAAGLSVGVVHALEHGRLSIQLDNFLRVLAVLALSPEDVLRDIAPQQTTSAPIERAISERARTDLPGLVKLIAEALSKTKKSKKPKARPSRRNRSET